MAFLRLGRAHKPPGILLKGRFLFSRSGMGVEARSCIPDQLSGEANTAQCRGSRPFIAQRAGRTTTEAPADT